MQEKTLPKPKIRTSNIHSGEVGSISYDIFGSPYQKTGSFLADDSLDFGYLGKPYNSDTELYDYGFRDYSPKIARFSTVDPIRDGRNWYSYVVNDPVNFVDLWGLLEMGADGFVFYAKSTTDGELIIETVTGNSGCIIEIVNGYLKTDNGTKIEAYYKTSRDINWHENYDCHGFTFTNGTFWINNEEVEKILEGDNYQQTSTPIPNGILIQRDNEGKIFHSAKILEYDENKNKVKVQEAMGAAVFKDSNGEINKTREFWYEIDENRDSFYVKNPQTCRND